MDIISFFENLRPSDLDHLNDIYHEDAKFKDPFNELSGIDNIRKVYQHMFDSLNNPHFVIIDSIKENQKLFLTWDFLFEIKKREYRIHGSTYFELTREGLIINHRDYWDVGEELLLKIPILKTLYRSFANQFRLS